MASLLQQAAAATVLPAAEALQLQQKVLLLGSMLTYDPTLRLSQHTSSSNRQPATTAAAAQAGAAGPRKLLPEICWRPILLCFRLRWTWSCSRSGRRQRSDSRFF